VQKNKNERLLTIKKFAPMGRDNLCGRVADTLASKPLSTQRAFAAGRISRAARLFCSSAEPEAAFPGRASDSCCNLAGTGARRGVELAAKRSIIKKYLQHFSASGLHQFEIVTADIPRSEGFPVDLV
jgi:hypothetical protein